MFPMLPKVTFGVVFETFTVKGCWAKTCSGESMNMRRRNVERRFLVLGSWDIWFVFFEGIEEDQKDRQDEI